MPDFKLPESLVFKADDLEFVSEHLEGYREFLARRLNALLTERLAKLETAVGDKWDSPQSPTPLTFFICEKTDMPWVTHATKILPPWELE